MIADMGKNSPKARYFLCNTKLTQLYPKKAL